jgi:predicted lipoprotein
MSAPAATTPRHIPWRALGIAAAIAIVAAMALDASWRSDKAPRVTARPTFDAAAYGTKTYPKVVAAIDKRAVPVGDLAPAIQDDIDAAGKKYGSRQGSSPYNFAVSGEGIAGKPESGLLPVRVHGAGDVNVNVQIGPAINGTALRDAAGFITFNQFVNQVDYADAATALNNQVKAKVLKGVGDLEGKRVKFTGAFTYLAPTVMTVTPVRLETTG